MKTKNKIRFARLEAFKSIAEGLLREETFHAIERAAELFEKGKIEHLSIVSADPRIGVMGCIGNPTPEAVGQAIRENSWSTDFRPCSKKTCPVCQERSREDSKAAE
jgi:hypothetical protein